MIVQNVKTTLMFTLFPARLRGVLRSRQIQAVEAYVSTSSVNNSEGFFQL
jgi:hypothetical protein